MKSEFQRQLEALGFSAQKDKVDTKKPQILESKVSKNKAPKKKRAEAQRLTPPQARSFIRAYGRTYKPGSFEAKLYERAYIYLTGTDSIMSEKKARKIVSDWERAEERVYEKDYAIAKLVLTDVWVPPRRKANPQERYKGEKSFTEVQAKNIVKQYRNNYKDGSLEESLYKRAYRFLTGSNTIMDEAQAKNIVNRWYAWDNRVYEKEYAIAVLVLSGLWIAPKRKPVKGMSHQIKARCERRDMNASFKGSWVYKK